jgi:hypothetical protein
VLLLLDEADDMYKGESASTGRLNEQENELMRWERNVQALA